MKTQKTANVHRFHNLVAFSTENTATLYLDSKMAIKLGNLLVKYGQDVKKKRFSQSELNSTNISEEF